MNKKITLVEFLNRFSHNNMIRLLYKIKGGHTLVGNTWNDVSMDWEVAKGVGVFKDYANHNVESLASILMTEGNYTEAINIVIEKK